VGRSLPSLPVSIATDELQVQLLHPAAVPPARTRAGDAGFDLRCVEGFSLAPGERAVVGTGVAVALPDGTCGLVVPRSGLAARHGISVVNGPGLIDPSYRGEIRVVLVNLGSERYDGEPGDRIAQLLLVPFAAPATRVVEGLPESADDRGANGFGSSGR
jgi:dUTP pyrophosphatase